MNERNQHIIKKYSPQLDQIIQLLDQDNRFIHHLEVWSSHLEVVISHTNINPFDLLEDFGALKTDYIYQGFIPGTTTHIHPNNPLTLALFQEIDLTEYNENNYFKKNKLEIKKEFFYGYYASFMKIENYVIYPGIDDFNKHELITNYPDFLKTYNKKMLERYSESLFDVDSEEIEKFYTEDLWWAIKGGYKPNMDYFHNFINEQKSRLLIGRNFIEVIKDWMLDSKISDTLKTYISSPIEEKYFVDFLDRLCVDKNLVLFLML